VFFGMINRSYSLKRCLNKEVLFKIENNSFKIIITEPILTSKGVKDGGIQQVDPEARF
jgi:hypothetical protein